MIDDPKQEALESVRQAATGHLTTQQGVLVDDTDNALRAGERGPTLLEDFHAREKITHFDHERIPERVVHARGSGACGYFELEESLAEWTSADFLQRPGERTPTFVRFSTVAGSRGSADTMRDVRGFATKFRAGPIGEPCRVSGPQPLYNPRSSVASRKAAMLVAAGGGVDDVQACRSALEAKEVVVETVAEHGGEISGVAVDRALATVGSVLYDPVIVLAAPAPSPEPTMTMSDFVLEAFRHGKPIGASGLGTELVLRLGLLAPDHLAEAGGERVAVDGGVVVSQTPHPGSRFFDSFLAALAAGRHWDRGVPVPGG